MKKKPRSLIKKFILHLFAALFCIIAVIFLVFGIKGYSMYRDAVTAYPIPQMVSSIQSRENFVEYEELPTIYIDASIIKPNTRRSMETENCLCSPDLKNFLVFG